MPPWEGRRYKGRRRREPKSEEKPNAETLRAQRGRGEERCRPRKGGATKPGIEKQGRPDWIPEKHGAGSTATNGCAT
jgi:hypothetical protein